jgi:hypothetical protein
MTKSIERFQTIHPRGLKSPNIDKAKYDYMRMAILQLLGEHDQISFKDAMEEIYERHKHSFDGMIPWYYTTVKLDLEARGELIRIPGMGIQMIRKA